MVNYKTHNSIVLDMLNYLKLVQPSLDTKPGSVARDLFVDSQAEQISNIWIEIQKIYLLQSLSNLTGQDLINYGSNFGLSKQSGTKSYGSVLFTFKSIETDILISQNSVVRTKNGIPFLTNSSTTVTKSQSGALKATATKYRQELLTVGITDEYAIQIDVEAQSIGAQGNISSYSVVSSNVAGVSNVTNIAPFAGGTNIESDASFKSRILSVFSASNMGTSSAYRSIILSLPNAIDALVIEPGDPLMVRDGSVVYTDSNGNKIVSEPGSGGKIDIYVMGKNSQSNIDSFVYYEKSGTGDATNSDNDFILGQSSSTASVNLSLNSRRVSTLSEKTTSIPTQPINKIVSVSGSSSGSNFIERYIDEFGQLKGNYELIKDNGNAGGSSFGLDRLHWTSNEIELTGEPVVKSNLNSIDPLTYTNINKITSITQNIQVINENSSIDSTRQYIITKLTPIKTVTRVFNLTTGERYVISDQNPDGTSDLNYTGRVLITGSTLPTTSDILQVDYVWVKSYDGNIDFDNFDPKDSLNYAQDSVEWGFSNYIKNEIKQVNNDSYGNLTVTTDYPVNRVLSVNTYEKENLLVSSGKTIITSKTILNIYKIKDISNNNIEVFNTTANDGTFSNKLITLPTDSLANIGDIVEVTYNLNNISVNKLFINNTITIDISTAPGTNVLINYVSSALDIIPLNTSLTKLPISGDGYNSFVNIDGYQPAQQKFLGETIISNVKKSPTNLVVTLNNIAPAGGLLMISGLAIYKVYGTIISSDSGDVIDLSSLIRKAEGLSNTSPVSQMTVCRVLKMQQATLNSYGTVDSYGSTYDLLNYKLNDNKYDKENSISDISISKTSFGIMNTNINSSLAIETGSVLYVEFYYIKNISETLYFSRSGSLITKNKFMYLSSINRVSGLKDSSGNILGSMQIISSNQPNPNETYNVNYNYSAPKENERITISYEYNKLITDSTIAIDNNRPVTADVLVKEALETLIDVSAAIVVSSDYENQSATVQQDAANNISQTLSSNSLGTTLDFSDIANNLYSVPGVDRVRIVRFNRHNVEGTKLSITAQKNEYLAPGTINVTVEDRK